MLEDCVEHRYALRLTHPFEFILLAAEAAATVVGFLWFTVHVRYVVDAKTQKSEIVTLL